MQTQTDAPAIAPLITDPEAARVLSVSEGFLRHDRTRAKPLIPFVKLGMAVRYSPAALDQFIRNGGAAA